MFNFCYTFIISEFKVRTLPRGRADQDSILIFVTLFIILGFKVRILPKGRAGQDSILEEYSNVVGKVKIFRFVKKSPHHWQTITIPINHVTFCCHTAVRVCQG